jgi:hypothetical protein
MILRDLNVVGNWRIDLGRQLNPDRPFHRGSLQCQEVDYVIQAPTQRSTSTAAQGLEVIRGAFGTNLVGADLVEISPPYDSSGNTALLGANLLFEMLCSFPGCKRRIAVSGLSSA